RTEIAAERRVYLACAAVIVAAVVAAAYALRSRPRLFVGASAAVAALLLVVTVRRSTLYANPEGLWRDALAKQPDNPRAYDNLAAVIYKKDRGRVGEADSLWTRSIALDSTYMPAWSNLAQVRVDQGRGAEARALLEHAVRINPDYVDATRRLGGLLAAQGDTKSISYLERMASSPDTTDELFVALGQAYVDANRLDDATTALRRALALNPHRADAAALLGGLLAQQGAMADALQYLASAAANGDRNPMTFALLSLGYAQDHRVEESVSAAKQAATLEAGATGSNAQVYMTIGRAMMDVGLADLADAYLTEATRLAPNYPEAITRLGLLRAAKGEMGPAVELFKRALRVSPGYPPALQALAKAGVR
ncbi:MAG TPA: tetratricopeptide repeat protein, partial [Gemmatimonadaceae bacterium]